MWQKLKNWVAEQVVWAENNLKDASGEEKRAAVVKRLDEVIKLPWYMEWLDDIILGYLIDMITKQLNKITGHNITAATEEQIIDAAESVKEPEIERTIAQAQITPTDNFFPVVGALSRNLTRFEVTCRCGCGACVISQNLINTFQTIRDYIGKPITVNSGYRCQAHNKKVGGAENSAHTIGEALDIKVVGMPQIELGGVVKKLHAEGKLPHLRYCYLISGSKEAVHIGTDSKKRYRIFGW